MDRYWINAAAESAANSAVSGTKGEIARLKKRLADVEARLASLEHAADVELEISRQQGEMED